MEEKTLSDKQSDTQITMPPSGSIEMSDNCSSLFKSLAKAQTEMDGIVKDAVNPFFKSEYATIESVINAVRPALNNNGLAIMQFPTTTDRSAGVMTMITHESGEWIRSWYRMPVSKQDTHGFGGAITYSRRYAIVSMLCSGAPDGDDDGNVNAKETKQPKKD